MGRFCHKCGQENIEPKESIWHLLNHFINDITHFDGKFFSSLKYLIIKPGFLSKEYMIGRRASYLNPVRMYLFTSAIFFLIFFSIFKINVNTSKDLLNTGDIMKVDSATFKELVNTTNNGIPISREALKDKLDSADAMSFFGSNFKSKRQYDSLLRTGAKHDNWFKRKLVYKSIELNTKYKGKGGTLFKDLIEKFIHTLPQMLFVMLPMFALILKLLYIRKKDFYYTDHFIFTLHIYIFIFIALMAIFGINKIEELLHWDWLGYISGALAISIFFYFYKSLRNFYKQRRAKTIFKYFIILFLLLFICLILFSFFFFLSLFQI